MAAIVVNELVKEYGPVRAVDGLSFTVGEGEVFALLGPNGAGKTTTVEILTGHRPRTGGRVSVLGFDPATGGREFRERIGVVLQSAGFEEEFTVRELVRLQASLFPKVNDPDDLIELVGLADKRSARTKTLSGGQRRRLDLALGLVGAPDLLFLDEPTTGFDPSARHHAWDLVAGLRERGTTILLTTHYMDEAQRLADRVAVVRAGRLVAIGRPDELGGRTLARSTITFRLPGRSSTVELPRLAGTIGRDGDVGGDAGGDAGGDVVTLQTDEPVRDIHTLSGWALDRGLDLSSLTLTRPTLEQVYLQLTGEPGDAH